MSITQQKSDMREMIHRKIEQRLSEKPQDAPEIAIGAIRRLSGKMTLNELRQWHSALYIITEEM